MRKVAAPDRGLDERIAARWLWDITFATNKDTLKAGETSAGVRRVSVDAETETESRLVAEQMVAATGVEPTSAELIDVEDYVE